MVSLTLVLNETLSVRLAIFVGIVSSFFLVLLLALTHRWATNLLFRGFSIFQPSMLLLLSFMVYNALRFAFLLMGAAAQHMDVEDLIIPSIVYLFSSAVLIHLWAKFSNELGRLYCGTPPRRILLVPAIGTFLLSILLAVSSQVCSLLPNQLQDGCINVSVAVDVTSCFLTGVALIVVSRDLQKTFQELSVDELLTSVQYHKRGGGIQNDRTQGGAGSGAHHGGGEGSPTANSINSSTNNDKKEGNGSGESLRNAALEQPKRLRRGVFLFGLYSVFRGPFILAFNFTGNYLNTTMSPGCVFYTVEALAMGISLRVLIGPPLAFMSSSNSSTHERSLLGDSSRGSSSPEATGKSAGIQVENAKRSRPISPRTATHKQQGQNRNSRAGPANQGLNAGASNSDTSSIGGSHRHSYIADRGVLDSDRPYVGSASTLKSYPSNYGMSNHRRRAETTISMDCVNEGSARQPQSSADHQNNKRESSVVYPLASSSRGSGLYTNNSTVTMHNNADSFYSQPTHSALALGNNTSTTNHMESQSGRSVGSPIFVGGTLRGVSYDRHGGTEPPSSNAAFATGSSNREFSGYGVGNTISPRRSSNLGPQANGSLSSTANFESAPPRRQSPQASSSSRRIATLYQQRTSPGGYSSSSSLALNGSSGTQYPTLRRAASALLAGHAAVSRSANNSPTSTKRHTLNNDTDTHTNLNNTYNPITMKGNDFLSVMAKNKEDSAYRLGSEGGGGATDNTTNTDHSSPQFNSTSPLNSQNRLSPGRSRRTRIDATDGDTATIPPTSHRNDLPTSQISFEGDDDEDEFRLSSRRLLGRPTSGGRRGRTASHETDGEESKGFLFSGHENRVTSQFRGD